MLKEILLWLERVLPGILTAFGIGYKMGGDGREELEKELIDEKLEHEKTKNKLKVESDSTPAIDALESIIKSGEELLKRSGKDGDS